MYGVDGNGDESPENQGMHNANTTVFAIQYSFLTQKINEEPFKAFTMPVF